MDINIAKQAGTLAAQIEEVTAALAAVDAAIAGGATVSLVQVVLDGRQIPIFAGSLDAASSAQGLQFVRGLYQARLDALNAALGAI